MRTTSEGAGGTEKLLSLLFLAIPLVALAAGGPFKFESHRDGPRVRSSARVAWSGQEITLEEREGDVAARGLVLEAKGSGAAAVLWIEGTSGKQGRVAVYSLPAAKLLTQSDWYERPTLEAWGTDGFQVGAPLHRLELSPPWLRLQRRFRVSSGAVSAAGSVKQEPSTPDQTLEWAADELEAGDPAAANDRLEALRKEHGEKLKGTPEMCACLHLLARAETKLGRGQELMSTLGRLSADYDSEPAGPWAKEALSSIARLGLQSYLERENK